MDCVVYYTGQEAIASVPRKAAEAVEALKIEPREASKIDPRRLLNRRNAADKAVEGSKRSSKSEARGGQNGLLEASGELLGGS